MKIYELNDIVQMKKQHPCGTNCWQIIRTGIDVKLQCTGRGHIVMMSRQKFEKHLKKVLEHAENEAD